MPAVTARTRTCGTPREWKSARNERRVVPRANRSSPIDGFPRDRFSCINVAHVAHFDRRSDDGRNSQMFFSRETSGSRRANRHLWWRLNLHKSSQTFYGDIKFLFDREKRYLKTYLRDTNFVSMWIRTLCILFTEVNYVKFTYVNKLFIFKVSQKKCKSNLNEDCRYSKHFPRKHAMILLNPDLRISQK